MDSVIGIGLTAVMAVGLAACNLDQVVQGTERGARTHAPGFSQCVASASEVQPPTSDRRPSQMGRLVKPCSLLAPAAQRTSVSVEVAPDQRHLFLYFTGGLPGDDCGLLQAAGAKSTPSAVDLTVRLGSFTTRGACSTVGFSYVTELLLPQPLGARPITSSAGVDRVFYSEDAGLRLPDGCSIASTAPLLVNQPAQAFPLVRAAAPCGLIGRDEIASIQLAVIGKDELQVSAYFYGSSGLCHRLLRVDVSTTEALVRINLVLGEGLDQGPVGPTGAVCPPPGTVPYVTNVLLPEKLGTRSLESAAPIGSLVRL